MAVIEGRKKKRMKGERKSLSCSFNGGIIPAVFRRNDQVDAGNLKIDYPGGVTDYAGMLGCAVGLFPALFQHYPAQNRPSLARCVMDLYGVLTEAVCVCLLLGG
eukprot:scpid108524/ scgid15386/ 